MGSVMGCRTHSHYVHKEIFKQGPHVIAGIYLLHLHLGVDVTMVEEIDVRCLHLSKHPSITLQQ